MKEATAILEPVLVEPGCAPSHRRSIGTVKGDLHDIGKNLVAMMWKGAGIEVVDLGVERARAEEFVEAPESTARASSACRALLTTTMVDMRDVVAAVTRRGRSTTARA